MLETLFHPVVANWFRRKFGEPTEPQRLGWPEITAGRNTLIAAPTGSGKTLAAFLACLDKLVTQALAGELPDTTQVVYVSPLKALSNDIQRNLQAPLAEIQAAAEAAGLPTLPIRAMVRTGDTPASVRASMAKTPPHILVTTPESLYIMLTSPKARETLRDVHTVIVDEIHALARDKRGSHLTLTLERLAALCHVPPVRIGLSATQRPMDQIAKFLVGHGTRDESASGTGEHATQLTLFDAQCSIIDVGHIRDLDLALEVPPSELSAVCSTEQWGEIYQRLIELINSHRSTLVFVNTRRMAERVAHSLTEMLGEDAVASHHGSLSREIRLSAEERLKNGQLKAIVATASLEMGIDVGYIDLVCQIGSPRAIATFLQRVGRSGHSLGATPKGRLFPLTRDELLECLSLQKAVKAGHLDQIEIPEGPLDILAQQIVAATACDEWDENDLYELCRRAWPFRNLTRAVFDEILSMLHAGVAPQTRRGAYLQRDQINGRVAARRHARIAAVTSGGAIPEVADFRVVTEEDRTFIGQVNEDFALESMIGDVFILGTSSWRILRVRDGEVVVADAQGAPASIPFWLGEAPGRTIELCDEISTVRREVAARIELPQADSAQPIPVPADAGFGADDERVCTLNTTNDRREAGALFWGQATGLAENSPRDIASGHTESHPQGRSLSRFFAPEDFDPETLDVDLTAAMAWLKENCGANDWAAEQAARYVAAQKAALGVVPTGDEIVFERFFDEAGGMQLIVHAPLGSRITRAWGLAFRKRFCRTFDFELQAAADDNALLLSLSPQHSFPIESLFKMLLPENGQHLLIQALLAAPMFPTRWRWNATRSLAILRQRNGKKVPPQLQRFQSDDLLAAVFPAQAGCFENHHGDKEIPDHPLIRQTIHDCLTEAMDVRRWLDLLARFRAGQVKFLARDTREPSPFTHEILNSNPYTFLDDAPAEERRTRAVSTRRTLSVRSFHDLGRLDPDAIAQVTAEAWPVVRDANELHDVLHALVVMLPSEAPSWARWFDTLRERGRATLVRRSQGEPLWIAAERWPVIQALYPDATAAPTPALPESLRKTWEPSEAVTALMRGRMPYSGPVTASHWASLFQIDTSRLSASLMAIESDGTVMRGHYTQSGFFDEQGNVRRAIDHGEDPTREIEWCDRRLLARIHRYTLEGLRRRIQPVSPTDYIRFLTQHHRLLPDQRRHGRAGVRETIAQLQGCEIPASVWEAKILAARVAAYEPYWLDELSLSGEVAWGRLRPPARNKDDGPSSAPITRAAPLSLALREDLAWLLPADREGAEEFARGNAQLVLEALRTRGALFPHELRAVTALLPAQMEEALHELAALGLVTADSFGAIRPLVAPGGKQKKLKVRAHVRRVGAQIRSIAPAGRWSLFPGLLPETNDDERIERWIKLLLFRWGVLFKDILQQESVAPPWYRLLFVLRRMEARGELHGGRFIAGVSGEQYALPDVISQLRRVRDEAPTGIGIVLSAADPLNLAGVITDEPRIPAKHTFTVALRDGKLWASQRSGLIDFHGEVSAEQQADMSRKLKKLSLAAG